MLPKRQGDQVNKVRRLLCWWHFTKKHLLCLGFADDDKIVRYIFENVKSITLNFEMQIICYLID